jgi:hypothetical protein
MSTLDTLRSIPIHHLLNDCEINRLRSLVNILNRPHPNGAKWTVSKLLCVYGWAGCADKFLEATGTSFYAKPEASGVPTTEV